MQMSNHNLSVLKNKKKIDQIMITWPKATGIKNKIKAIAEMHNMKVAQWIKSTIENSVEFQNFKY